MTGTTGLTIQWLLPLAVGLIIGSSLLGCFSPNREEERLDVWIGQMLMVGFRGTDLDEEDPFLQTVRDLHLGGVVMFDYDVPSQTPVRNIVSSEQITKLTAQLQASSSIPLFISIDQEGGKVARLKERHGFPPTPSQAELGSLDQTEHRKQETEDDLETVLSTDADLRY